MALVGRIPGKKGLTPEAKEAMREQANQMLLDMEGEQDVSEADPIVTEPFEAGTVGRALFPEDESGDGIEDSRLRTEAKPPPEAREPKPGVPALDEWMDFWSRIFLRVVLDWYIDLAFRGIDETIISDRDIARLQLTDDERKRIATPLAELSHKSKLMRRYGRTIIASGGAFDAIVTLGAWTSRVNRIARKYKPHTVHGRVVPNERFSQSEPSDQGGATTGANGGRVGDYVIFNPGT
jgi:hypothetical protein